MENLINGVLDYSRIGRTKIVNESIDIWILCCPKLLSGTEGLQGFKRSGWNTSNFQCQNISVPVTLILLVMP
jgi:hypothetical protein